MQLPEAVVTRFRSLSLERVSRVEATWNALVQGVEDDEAVRTMSRDLHTLKGDARIVGFDEVHLLTHKLEEVLALAAQHEYRVSEDFELVVTMATQFLGMLLRKKSGGASGIDIAGFVQQVDEVLRETRAMRRPRSTPPPRTLCAALDVPVDRLSEATRQRIAIAATNAFLEYLSARSPASRSRLRGVWQTLSKELAQMQTVPLAPLAERHAPAAREIAAELGKQVDLEIALDGVQLDARVAEAVDMAIIHLVRNAIDHGIEAPAARVTAGKPARGSVRVFARDAANRIEIVVEDDGGGIDLAAVRANAIERGLLDAERGTAVSPRELLELVFQPGFTTRGDVSAISGRGVGMDAVKAALARVGGSVRITNRPGRGAAVALVVPAPSRHMRVYRFHATGSINVAVSARWSPTVETSATFDAIDPLAAIQLTGGGHQTINGVVMPAHEHTLRLRWGFLQLALRAASAPTLVSAERICPTPDDHPVEVIFIDGVETLLVRPEHVPAATRCGGERRPP